jgi:NitT/TauT family transport system ATP-binding protein
MKQRVGIARALSVDPEILFMDEPFSHVDALTAESLRAEVIDIWAAHDKNPSSVLMVSHDIPEVVYMADRIVVLGTHPGHILKVLENPLPRPRDYRAPEFNKLVDQLHEIITGHEIPDVPEPVLQPNELPPAESLPECIPSEIVGILEYLDARGGKEDVFRIATETDKEFGDIIKVVKSAELLDFVDTPKRQVVLTADGQRFVKATSQQRQVIWREQLLKLRLFKQVYDMLLKHPRKKLDAEIVQEIIIFNLPSENYEKTFITFAQWAQYGNLFAYDEETQKLFFPRKRSPRPKPKTESTATELTASTPPTMSEESSTTTETTIPVTSSTSTEPSKTEEPPTNKT